MKKALFLLGIIAMTLFACSKSDSNGADTDSAEATSENIPDRSEPGPFTEDCEFSVFDAKLNLGMDQGSFLETCPAIFEAPFPDPNADAEQYNLMGNLMDLEGTWTFSFKGEKLSSYRFSYTQFAADRNDSTFQLCLKQSLNLVEHYTEKFGEPYEKIEGPQEFNKKTEEGANEVLSVSWKLDDTWVDLEFEDHGTPVNGDSYLSVFLSVITPPYKVSSRPS